MGHEMGAQIQVETPENGAEGGEAGRRKRGFSGGGGRPLMREDIERQYLSEEGRTQTGSVQRKGCPSSFRHTKNKARFLSRQRGEGGERKLGGGRSSIRGNGERGWDIAQSIGGKKEKMDHS